jgi:hypothetical protein
MTYRVGDVVFWALHTVTGEAFFIRYPKTAKHDEVLVLAKAAGVEIDAAVCRPTGRSYAATGREYRLRYLRQNPGKLKGNP